jgi:NAD-dependent deacetylase sirtuin 7
MASKKEEYSFEIKQEDGCSFLNDSSELNPENESVASQHRTRSGRFVKHTSDYLEKQERKEQRRSLLNQIRSAIEKEACERSQSDLDVMNNFPDLVEQVNACKRNKLAMEAHKEIVLDDESTLNEKCNELAELVYNSKCCVVYTGAGISTAASIPDYRGPQGLWTMLEQGKKVEVPDFAQVKPTISHMCLKALMNMGIVKYIVSQNCDGLHVRSGINREQLSELHGNCFVEFCPECFHEYVRDFDVTERTSYRKHSTGRFCSNCSKIEEKIELRDSIIHFGEKLRNGSPYNWELAQESIKNADLIVCFGSSLKVLKHYRCLWPKKIGSAYQLCIVNIQWTPKDKWARLKINGYCDQVFEKLFQRLNSVYLNKSKRLHVEEYSLDSDPIIKISTSLTPEELATTNKNFLTQIKKNSDRLSVKRRSKGIEDGQESSREAQNVEQNQVETEHSASWYLKSFKKKKKA